MTERQAPEIRMYLVAGTSVACDEDEFGTAEDGPLIDRIRRELLGGYDGLTGVLDDMGLLDDVEMVVEVAERDENGRHHHSSTTLTHEMFALTASVRMAEDLLRAGKESRERAAGAVRVETRGELL